MLHAFRILQKASQHLVAPADSHNPAAFSGKPLDSRFQAILPHPEQIRHRIFASGEQKQIRLSQLPRRLYIPDGNSLTAFQHAEIREIRDMGNADDRCVNPSCRCALFQLLRQAVLFINIQSDIRDDSRNRNAALVIQLLQSRIQDGFIPAEFIDHKSFYPGPFFFLQKPDGSQQLGKHTAPVNISHQKYWRVHKSRKAHVDDIVFLQIDFRRASRPLNNYDVIPAVKLPISLHNRRNQAFFHPEVIPRFPVSEHFAVYNYLGAHVAVWLQQNGIHPDIRLNPRRFRLPYLCPSHLQAFPGNIGIQRHILGFKRGHTIAVLLKHPQDPRRQYAFPRIGHRPLNHQIFCHAASSS